MFFNSPVSVSCRRRFPGTRGHVHVACVFQLRLSRVEFKGESLGSNRTWSYICRSVCVTFGNPFHIPESRFP